MTVRALGLLLGGAALIILGWNSGWPELTAIGAASIALVVLSLVVAGRAPRVQVALDQTTMKVVRGQQATVRMTLQMPRRRWRWLRVVEGPVSAPVATSPLTEPSPAGELSVKLPVDTSVRGERPIGPYSVVHGDPWSIVRRIAARPDGGVLTVLPRTVPVRHSALPMLNEGDSTSAGRRRGDEHFFALREYVIGDEPRLVHWRSSARAGKLVVMQQVAPTPNHTMIVLDADASAYGHDDQFAGGFVAERFEDAVDVAASLALAQEDQAEQVHVVTTARGASVTSAAGGMSAALLDAFAAVRSVAPVDTAPHEVVPLVRRLRCRLVLFVTGTPSVHVVSAMRAVAPVTSSFAVVRVGSRRQEPLPGLQVLDVERVEDLEAA